MCMDIFGNKLLTYWSKWNSARVEVIHRSIYKHTSTLCCDVITGV